MYNKSLGNAFDVLELVSTHPNGLKMTEIGRRLDLNKSTIYRLLAEMKNRGYIYQDGNRGVYRIGIKFIELVGAYLNNVELKTEAHPILRRLNALVDQTVYLAILQDDHVVYIDRIEKYNSFRKYTFIGQRKPVHCTSLGKSLTLTMADNEVSALLRRQGMERRTPNTITTERGFLEELERSRARGWCVDNQEIEEGVRCVSAPILDYQKKAIAAISVSWFVDFNDVREEELGGRLVEAANEVSRRMGCTTDIQDVLTQPAAAEKQAPVTLERV